jgi:2-deoxy-D-gluconate 3-dehydrogenase
VPKNLFDLSGRVALVTGASRGLGAAAAEALAAAGADVVLLGRDRVALEAVAQRLSRHGRRAAIVTADLSDHDSIPLAFDQSTRALDRIDILVNNAGIIRRAPADEYSIEDWRAVIDTDLTAYFLMAQEAGREMLARGSGKIINIASLLSFSGGLNVVAYTAAKSGVAGLTRALANEWARYGVNVNAIAPGYFHTDATETLQTDPERYAALSARIPARRWGEPPDLAGTFIYLASRASDYVHGHILAVDGGWMAA